MLKEDVTIALENLVEHNAGVRPAHQFCQFALALPEWPAPQVFALDSDQVESDQYRILTVALVPNELEHCQAAVIGDDSFAVEQE